jgi:hypothetical protein
MILLEYPANKVEPSDDHAKHVQAGILSPVSGSGTKGVDHNFGFQIPNLDGIVRGGTQPVTVGRKDQFVVPPSKSDPAVIPCQIQ